MYLICSLLVGMLASIGTLFIRAQSPYTCLLGCIPNTDIYLDINRYKAVSNMKNIYKILQFSKYNIYVLLSNVPRCDVEYNFRLLKYLVLKSSTIVEVSILQAKANSKIHSTERLALKLKRKLIFTKMACLKKIIQRIPYHLNTHTTTTEYANKI